MFRRGTTMTVLAVLCLTVGGCADVDWRAMGRRSLENYCGDNADCDRSCATATGARTVGDCRLAHGAP